MDKNKVVQASDAPNENTGFQKTKSIDKKSIVPAIIPSPIKAYTDNIGRGRTPTLRWETPEWDLVETGRIIDTESFAMRAVRVKKNLFIKEGYEFVGNDIARVRYIKKRFQQMEKATKYPYPMLISDTIASLERTSNAFWVKARKASASGGKIRYTEKGKKIEPIAGYFLLPAETVRFKRDEYGTLKMYQQEVYGKEQREFKPDDVIHFHINKRPGFSVGTPDLTSIKDDIRALRRLEENVELLLYNHLFPLFHYQVGTQDAPAATFPDGTSEIDIVKITVAQIPSDGCWVTPERHKITPLQGASPPIAVEKVIEHFKNRIYVGFGVSSVDMGEGGTANRSTASTMSKNLIDNTKTDQQEFGAQFYLYVIQELMEESTFPKSTLYDEENKVTLKFKEIDIEAKLAKENHYADLFLKNLITHVEARNSMGMEPFAGNAWPTKSGGSGDWAMTNHGLIERDTIILQAMDEPGTDESRAEVKSRTTTQASPGAANSISNKNQPQNQHGTRSSTKLNKDALNHIETPLGDIFDSIQKELINKIYSFGITKENINLAIGGAFEQAKDRLLIACKHAYRSGLLETGHMIYEVQIDKIDAKIQGHVEKYVYKLRDQVIAALKTNTVGDIETRQVDATLASLVFDSLKHRTRMIDTSEITRAYNYGVCSGHKINGFNEIRSQRTNSNPCKICDNQILKYKYTDAIIYEELPPFHPHCYSKDTEVLTESGFKLIKDIKIGENILSLNPDNFDLELIPVVNKIKHYADKLIRFKSKTFDLAVTPEHKMVFRTDWAYKNKQHKLRFLEAKDLNKSSVFYRSSEWKGISLEFIKIGNYKIKTDVFVKFMGWFLSEGSCSKRSDNSYQITIAQQKYREKCLNDLKQLPFNIWKTEEGFGFYDKDFGKYLSKFGYSHEKFIPKEIKQLSSEYIRYFLDAFRLGDGSTRKVSYTGKVGNFQNELTYVTSSKQLADDLGELILKVGRRPSFKINKTKGKLIKHHNGNYITNHDIITIRECYKQNSILANIDSYEEVYNNMVYCVELEKNHTLYVKRNGKCVWSGNCSCRMQIVGQ